MRVESELRSWPHYAVATTALLLWIGYMYRDTALSLISIWERSATFTHCFLVVPIALWLIWRKRKVLLSGTPLVNPYLLVVVVALCMVWLMGAVVGANSVVQMAFVGILISAVVVLLGWRAARIIAFPLSFLFFAVPIGEFLLPLLMERTADFTVFALRMSGVPVHREGLQFVIPSGTWSVVEACSGVRYLIASVTIGALFAYLNYQSLKRRLIFVAVSILVPIVANWLRAYLIVMIGHLSNNKLATGVDHIIYGWIFFGVVVALMFAIGARWSQHEVMLPTLSPTKSSANFSPMALWITVVMTAVLVTLPHWAIRIASVVPSNAAFVPLAALINLNGGWSRENAILSDWRPLFENPNYVLDAVYRNDDELIGIYIAYYKDQDYDHKLISSVNILARSDSVAWQMENTGVNRVDCDNRFISVRTTVLRDTRRPDDRSVRKLTVWQFYWVNGVQTVNDQFAKFMSAFYRLTGRGDDSASVLVYAAGDQADDRLATFMRVNCALVDEQLQRVHAGR